MDIQNKVFVVTGGASGLGAETSRYLVEQGAQVVLVDMNLELGQSLAQELGEQVQFQAN